jgi:hypothetical protein
MTAVLHHMLLAVSLVALGAAGLRAGAALGAAGLLRVLAAVPIAATAAALETLALGLVDLGSDPLALTLGACGVWLLAVSRLSPPKSRLSVELHREWAGVSPPIRVTVAALAGIIIALTVWFLRNPALVGDGLIYHLPIVATWVTSGDPPSLIPVTTDAQLQAYPLTNELLLTWASGIGRSFVPVTVWDPSMIALLVLAGWSGLRSLAIPRLPAALAIAALATSPLLVHQLNTFMTDTPALAWLVCCGALCAGAVRAPGLLVAAVLAAGLAVGTKTTTAPAALICLVAALVATRGRVRPFAGALTAAAVAAGIVGGLWYFRNLVLHGSPLWPFVSTPWGDQLGALARQVDGRLLWDLASTQGRLDDYARELYGSLVLLGGGLVAALLVPSRRVLAASAATAVLLLIWANAPFTAFPQLGIFDGLQAGAVRYLLPAIAAGALALALAGSRDGDTRNLAVALLAIALLANLVGDARLGFVSGFQHVAPLEVDPMLPSVAVPLAGAAVGAACAVALKLVRGLRRPMWATLPRRLSPIGWIVGASLAGALLAIPASGYVERSTRLQSTPAGAAWLVRQQRYADGDAPVAMQNRTIGTLAGDQLRHRLTLIPINPHCSRLREDAREDWVVIPVPQSPVPRGGVGTRVFTNRIRGVRAGQLAAARCLAARHPVYRDKELRIYAPDQPG